MGALTSAASGLPVEDIFGLRPSSGHGAGLPPSPPPPPTNSGHGAGIPPASPPPTGTPPPDNGGAGTPAQPPPPPGAPNPYGQYDLNADPVLQQVNAITALADQNAQSSALRNREQLLLQYGDPTLAASVLGANDPYVLAAGQNQESTLAQLLRGYHNGLQNYDENLDPSLAFSGARVRDEGQIGQTYQDSLAAAAAGLQGGLGSISDQLNAALEADNAQRAQALADAYQRAVANALANPPARGGKNKGKNGKGR